MHFATSNSYNCLQQPNIGPSYRARIGYFILLLIFFTGYTYAAPSLNFRVTGLSDSAQKNALDRLGALLPSKDSHLSPSTIKKIYTQGPKNIKQAIAPFGYFKPQIRSVLVKQNSESYLASYHVTPGPALKIEKIKVQITGPGSNNSTLTKFVAHFPIHSGQTFNAERYNDAKQKLLQLALSQGYLDARLKRHMVSIDLNHYVAKIDLLLATGPRYKFGQITFTHTRLSQKFLARYVHIKPGQPYSSKQLMRLQQALVSSDYFQQVTVHPEKQLAHHLRVPVRVNLVMQKAKQYSFGVGFGTDTGVRGSFSTNWRYVNAYGHHFKTSIQASQIQQSFLASYVIPGRNPLTEQYTINAGVNYQHQPAGKYLTQLFGVSKINKWHTWQQTLSLNFQRDRYKLDGESYKESHFLLPGVNWSHIVSNDPLHPTHGYRINVLLQGASENILSTTSFIQGEIQAKALYTFLSNNRLIFRGDFGYTAAKDFQNKMPLSLRFTAGGAQSVRGYGYQDLGPGRYLAVGSAEYQHRIYHNWYGAIFFDTGNAFNHFNTTLKRAVGIGAVWLSPIGTLELSLAKPISDHSHGIRLQFSMGPDL